MNILVYRPSGNLGPYSEFDLRSMIQSGLIRSNELAWREGMRDWQPISTFVSLSSSLSGAASPSVPAAISGVTSDDTTRHQYLKAEANVRSIGLLYYIGSFVMVLAAVAVFLRTSQEPHPPVVHRILPFVLIALAVLYFWMARKIRALDPVVIVPATIVACIGMFSFPVGTIFNGLVLFVLHCSKGHRVFTPEYRAVIARTPHIVYKTSLVVKVFLVLFLLAIVGVITLLALDTR